MNATRRGMESNSHALQFGENFPEEHDAVVERGGKERLLHEWLNIASPCEADWVVDDRAEASPREAARALSSTTL